jgi:hypothetical protein
MLFTDKKADYGPRLNVALWLMVSVAALFLFTRLYLKKCQNRGLWWDDYALLGAWVCQTTQACLVTYTIALGYGKPSSITAGKGAQLLLPVNFLSSFLITGNLLGKMSFGLTLLRIPVAWMRLAVLFIIITLTVTLCMSTALVWVECLGVKKSPHCIDPRVSLTYNMFSCGKVAPLGRKECGC